MKLEVMLLSAPPTASAPKLLAQRRQLHTINTALDGFVVAVIKVTNGDDRPDGACVHAPPCVCEGGGKLHAGSVVVILYDCYHCTA